MLSEFPTVKIPVIDRLIDFFIVRNGFKELLFEKSIPILILRLTKLDRFNIKIILTEFPTIEIPTKTFYNIGHESQTCLDDK